MPGDRSAGGGHARRTARRRDVGCGQECLRQIETAPDGCLVRTILERWYAGKSYAYCGRPIGAIEAWGHKVGLVSSGGETVEWGEVPPEQLPRLLATHAPACWNCNVAETFRRRYPDLVIERRHV